jgi:hypothetical protein
LLSDSLADLYEELPDLDFSRAILQGQEGYLRALAVPECGWSDLGTPERVAAALLDLEDFTPAVTPRIKSRAAINLATRHAQLRSRMPGAAAYS